MIYEKNRQNCLKSFKMTKVEKFLKYTKEKILEDKW